MLQRYEHGKVSATNGDNIVTGSGTRFTLYVQVYDMLWLNGGGYLIEDIIDDTHIALSSHYVDNTVNFVEYYIDRMYNLNQFTTTPSDANIMADGVDQAVFSDSLPPDTQVDMATTSEESAGDRSTKVDDGALALTSSIQDIITVKLSKHGYEDYEYTVIATDGLFITPTSVNCNTLGCYVGYIDPVLIDLAQVQVTSFDHVGTNNIVYPYNQDVETTTFDVSIQELLISLEQATIASALLDVIIHEIQQYSTEVNTTTLDVLVNAPEVGKTDLLVVDSNLNDITLVENTTIGVDLLVVDSNLNDITLVGVDYMYIGTLDIHITELQHTLSGVIDINLLETKVQTHGID